MGWLSRTSSPQWHVTPVLGMTQPFAKKLHSLMIQLCYSSWHQPFLVAFNHETKENCFTARSSAGVKGSWACLLKSESWAFMALSSSREALSFGGLGLRSTCSQDGAEGSLAVWKQRKQKHNLEELHWVSLSRLSPRKTSSGEKRILFGCVLREKTPFNRQQEYQFTSHHLHGLLLR